MRTLQPPTLVAPTAADSEALPTCRVKSRWRFRLRWPRPPRRAIPTIPGLFALSAPLFLGFAAVTATNNLLFLLLGATLGSVVLSGVLSERNIQPISIQLQALGPVYVGQTARLQVRFSRPHHALPAFDLRFRECVKRKVPEAVDVHLPVLDGESGTTTVERVFDKRGPARLAICELSTRYPFGLLTKSKDLEPSLAIMVRPKAVVCPPALLRRPQVKGEHETSARKGQGLDVYALRERTDRDAVHRVHALRSLALRREVVLEMTDTEQPTADIGVATGLGADPEALERALELVQAALKGWHAQGYAVGLTTFSGVFYPGREPLSLLLDHLAQVHPARMPVRDHCPRMWLVPIGAEAPAGVFTMRVGIDGALGSEGAA